MKIQDIIIICLPIIILPIFYFLNWVFVGAKFDIPILIILVGLSLCFYIYMAYLYNK